MLVLIRVPNSSLLLGVRSDPEQGWAQGSVCPGGEHLVEQPMNARNVSASSALLDVLTNLRPEPSSFVVTEAVDASCLTPKVSAVVMRPSRPRMRDKTRSEIRRRLHDDFVAASSTAFQGLSTLVGRFQWQTDGTPRQIRVREELSEFVAFDGKSSTTALLSSSF